MLLVELAGCNITDGSHNIDIDNLAGPADFSTIRIGEAQTRTFIAGIYGVTEGGTPAAVYINSNGQLGTSSSSRRFKKDVKPMDHASEAILSLKPVTFHYKSDTGDTPQFGLVAEEVAAINSDLVVRDRSGEIYTVRYEAINAMLLNEFLKEHRVVREQNGKIQQQEATITELKSTVAQQKKDFEATVAQLTARLDEQASQIQKASAQFETSRPEPQTVLNNR